MSTDTDILTVVVEYDDGAQFDDGYGCGGGAYEYGSAPRASRALAELIASARSEAREIVSGGCEWASVFVGAGDVEEVNCETAEMTFSYPS